MRELTLKLEFGFTYGKLEEYLYSLKGVIEVECGEYFYIKYDSSLINIEILKNEILLFLDLLNVPSVNFFDKHFKGEVILRICVVNFVYGK